MLRLLPLAGPLLGALEVGPHQAGGFGHDLLAHPLESSYLGHPTRSSDRLLDLVEVRVLPKDGGFMTTTTTEHARAVEVVEVEILVSLDVRELLPDLVTDPLLSLLAGFGWVSAICTPSWSVLDLIRIALRRGSDQGIILNLGSIRYPQPFPQVSHISGPQQGGRW